MEAITRPHLAPATGRLPAVLSVWDAISWIAFRELRPRPDFPDAVDFTLKWGHSSAAQTLAALEARASDTPFCIWEPLILDGRPWNGSRFKHVAWSPDGPKMLRWVVRQLSAKSGRLVSFAEAAKMLHDDLDEIRRSDIQTDHAKQDLIQALRIGTIRIWAKRDSRRGQANPAAQHEAVDISLFLDELVSVTEWGTIGPDPEHPVATFRYRGPTFREARLYSSDVLRLWAERQTGPISAPDLVAESRGGDAAPGDRDKQQAGHGATDGESLSTEPTKLRKRNVGGRPPKWDWIAFDAEVVRLANTPDGLPERPALMHQMLDWCAEHWGDTPTESVVRDRLSKLYPGAL